MGPEPEPEAFAESLHLRYWNHLASRAAQHDDMSVIDHRVAAASAEETESLGQEHLAVEALECRVALEVQHARVAQHGRCSVGRTLLARDLDQVRRRVMLKLLTWLKVVNS